MMTTAELRDPPWPKSYIFKDFAHAKGCSIGTAHPLFPSTACTYTFLGKSISQMEKKPPCQVYGLCDRGDAREPGGGRGGAATKQSQGVGCSRLKSVSEQGVHSRGALVEDPWFRRSLLRKKTITVPEQNWNSQSICDASYQQEVLTLWGRRGQQEWAQRRSLKRMLNTRGAGACLAADRAAWRWQPCSHLSHPCVVSVARRKVTPRPQHPVVKACGRHHQSRAAALPWVCQPPSNI